MMDMTKLADIEEIIEQGRGRDATLPILEAIWQVQFDGSDAAHTAALKISNVGNGWRAVPHEYVANRIVIARHSV